MALIRLLTLFLAGILGIALLLSWLQSSGVDPARDMQPESLPVAPVLDDSLLEAMLAKNIWDRERSPLSPTLSAEEAEAQAAAAAESTEEAEKAISWQLVGTSHQREGVQSFAIIATADGIENYRAGDRLPDGARLEAISTYGIEITKSGDNETIFIFGK